MSHIPSLGAHGKPATFSGSCGMSCADEAEAIAASKAFANMGAKSGGVYNIPAEQRQGAFEEDESVREYTGNPRDAAGSYGRPAAPNQPRRVSLPLERAE